MSIIKNFQQVVGKFNKKYKNKSDVLNNAELDLDADLNIGQNDGMSSNISMLQALEPRILFDAALGAEIAATIAPEVINDITSVDVDIDLNTDSLSIDFNDSIDSTINIDILTQEFDSDLHNINSDYYSFDKSLVKEIIFVDSNVDNYAELLNGVDFNKVISGELEIVVLKSDFSGIEQITNYLENYSHQIDALHIVSHGDVAELQLGSDILNNANLSNFDSDLHQWNNSFTNNNADILFYGCNVAEGVVGQQFIQDLHNIIETDIAASSDLTGSSALGGDWDLEVSHGVITASLAFNSQTINHYDKTLATITVDTLTDNNDAGLGYIDENTPNPTYDISYLQSNKGADGKISLREAIIAAHNTTGSDTIEFSVSGTINVTGSFLQTTNNAVDALTIDGTTAPGYTTFNPTITVNGGAIVGYSTFNIHKNYTLQGLNIEHAGVGSTVAAVFVSPGSTNVTIEHNVITNGNTGITINDSSSNGINISQNLIYNINTLLIDNGFNSTHEINDLNDTDSGANNLQNYPTITSYEVIDSDTIRLKGVLNSEASSNYRIEFFGDNNSPDTEARIYLGSTTISTDATSPYDASFDVTLDYTGGLSNITYISAIATNTGTNDTSEVSSSINANTKFAVDTTVDNNDAGLSQGNSSHDISYLLLNKGADGKISLREAIIAANNTVGTNTINFTTGSNGTVTLGSQLPAITSAIVIDGSTAPSYTTSIPSVIINAGANPGLVFDTGSSNSIVQGLNIQSNNDAITVTSNATGVKITKNVLTSGSNTFIDLLGSNGIDTNDINDVDTGGNDVINSLNIISVQQVNQNGLNINQITYSYNGEATPNENYDVQFHLYNTNTMQATQYLSEIQISVASGNLASTTLQMNQNFVHNRDAVYATVIDQTTGSTSEYSNPQRIFVDNLTPDMNILGLDTNGTFQTENLTPTILGNTNEPITSMTIEIQKLDEATSNYNTIISTNSNDSNFSLNNSTGEWSYNTTSLGLTNGTYRINYTQTDTANLTDSGTQAFILGPLPVNQTQQDTISAIASPSSSTSSSSTQSSSSSSTSSSQTSSSTDSSANNGDVIESSASTSSTTNSGSNNTDSASDSSSSSSSTQANQTSQSSQGSDGDAETTGSEGDDQVSDEQTSEDQSTDTQASDEQTSDNESEETTDNSNEESSNDSSDDSSDETTDKADQEGTQSSSKEDESATAAQQVNANSSVNVQTAAISSSSISTSQSSTNIGSKLSSGSSTTDLVSKVGISSDTKLIQQTLNNFIESNTTTINNAINNAFTIVNTNPGVATATVAAGTVAGGAVTIVVTKTIAGTVAHATYSLGGKTASAGLNMAQNVVGSGSTTSVGTGAGTSSASGGSIGSTGDSAQMTQSSGGNQIQDFNQEQDTEFSVQCPCPVCMATAGRNKK